MVLVLGLLGFGEDAADEAEGEEVHFVGVVLGVWWLFSRKMRMCVCVCCMCMLYVSRWEIIAPAQDNITIDHDKYVTSSAHHVVVVVERWSIKERSKMAIVDSR